jgi:peptide/nickel transport system substrate-binding protein
MTYDSPTKDRPRKRGRAHWKALSLPALGATAVLAIAGCGGSSSGDSSANSGSGATTVAFQGVTPTNNDQSLGLASTPATPTNGGKLTVAWEQEPPCLVGTWVQIGYLSQQYLEELVSAAPGGKVVPWLATSWKITNGGKTYTFQIKKNVKFTDGTPLTAQSVVDNFKSWLSTDPATQNGYVAAYIGDTFKSAKALDTNTLQINLKKPYTWFLSGLSQYAFGIQSPKAVARGAAVNCQKPVGTGPFVVQKWNHGQDVELRRNDNWNSWPANAKHKGPAYLSAIDWRFVSDNNTRWAALQSGGAQLLYDIPAVDWAAAQKQYTVLRHTTGGTPFRLFLAAKWGPLKDPNVRKAVVYGFNRAQDVPAAYQGERITNGNGSLSPANETYDAKLNTAFSYNPATAGKLLDAAGWTGRDAAGYRTKNGKELTARLVYGPDTNSDQDDAQLYQLLQADEKKIGIHVVLVPVPASQFWTSKQTTDGNWDIQPWYWVGRTAETLHVVWQPKILGAPNTFNATGYFDPKVWPLIQKLDQTSDAAQQTKISQQIQDILVQKDALVTGVSGMHVTLAASSKLHGVWQSPDVGEPVLSDAYLTQ